MINYADDDMKGKPANIIRLDELEQLNGKEILEMRVICGKQSEAMAYGVSRSAGIIKVRIKSE